MSPKMGDEESEDVLKVIDNTNEKLKFSGYNFLKGHHIIKAGITHYLKRKCASRERDERIFLMEEEA